MKDAILNTIKNDPYLNSYSVGRYLNTIFIDKDTSQIGQNPEDQQYFVIFKTTIPINDVQTANIIKNELTYLVGKYFWINRPPILDDETSEDVYWITIPIQYQ